jgi:HD-like signal output (HDOD) protein/GGDEF domain-containing protein
MNTAVCSPDVVSHFVTRARRLYSLPAVAVRVLELTDQPAVDTAALADCIEHDPALTTKILRVVNSSVYGLSQRIGNLKQAIGLLGTRPLKMLVLGFSLPTNLEAGASADVLARYWRHTLFKAVAAREIAESLYGASGDDAFVGGLLQNLGILVLVQDLGNSYEKFLINVWLKGGDLRSEELGVLGFDHQYLSARLLESWKLPESLVDAVGMPQDMETLSVLEEPRQMLPQTLHLADLVASFLTDPVPQLLDTLLQVGHRYLGLTMPQLEMLMSCLEKKAPQLAEVLSLELEGERNYTSVLVHAHRQLTDILDDATAELLSGARPPDEMLTSVEPRTAPPALVGRLAGLTDAPDLARTVSDRGPNVGSRDSAATPGTVWSFPVPAEGEDSVPARSETSVSRASELPWSTREGLIGRIAMSVGHCRQTRSSLSLLLVKLDDLKKVTFYCGVDETPQVVTRLGMTVRNLIDGDGIICQLDDGLFAVLLEGCDRRRGVAQAWHVVDGVRIWKYPAPTLTQTGLSVSIGLATLTMPPRNFPAEELLTAAERCLSGVQLSGGDGVKSIDIY